MKIVLMIIQIIVSVTLIGFIIIQARGTGLGRTFASSQTAFSRRGVEKLIYKTTFVLAGIFIIVSILQIII